MGAVLFDRRGHVAWLTLNRPTARNTINGDMFVELADAWQEVRDNDDIRVAVLTASGETDFCCGGDLAEVIPLWTGAKQPANDIEARLLADPTIVDKVMLKNEPMVKPVIGAINGRALGGGCELLQATDVRVAASHARFGLPEPRVGIVPGAGSMVRLARQLPYAHAMKILLTAESISAAKALAMGLISEVVDGADLQARAEELAAQISRLAPLAVQAIKRTVLETHVMPWTDAFQFEMEQSAQVMMSRDAREGGRAFRDKREPEFKFE